VTKKIRILHTEWSLGWGGQEIRIIEESKRLRELGHHIEIAAQKESIIFQRALDSGLQAHSVNFHKGIALSALMKLAMIIHRHRIEIIHTHSSVDSRISGIAAKLLGRKVVRSRHLSTRIKNSYLSKLLYMHIADHVITSSKSIMEQMVSVNKMEPTKITSIPAGTDTKRFFPKPKDSSIMEKYNISGDDKIVGIVAVLRSWKGHEDLFKAINIIKNHVSNIKLLVLGDGPQKNVLKKVALDLKIQDKIIFAGHIENPEDFYPIMDVVALSSYDNEATSQTLPQAMLTKKIVIGTNIGGIPEVVIHEVTGYLMRARDPDSIAECLLRALKDSTENRQITENGYNHALNNFSLDSSIEKTISIYEKILGFN